MRGLRLMLLCPNSAATTGSNPPGFDISTRSSYTSTITVAPSSYRSRWQMAFITASLKTSSGISHISRRGPVPLIIYSTSSLLSIHERVSRYCWYKGPPKVLSSIICTLSYPLKRRHLMIAWGNLRSESLPKKRAVAFFEKPSSVKSSRLSKSLLRGSVSERFDISIKVRKFRGSMSLSMSNHRQGMAS